MNRDVEDLPLPSHVLGLSSPSHMSPSPLCRLSLEPESDRRLKETYVEAVTGTLRLPLPRQGIFERSLFISYLDDDLLIVR